MKRKRTMVWFVSAFILCLGADVLSQPLLFKTLRAENKSTDQTQVLPAESRDRYVEARFDWFEYEGNDPVFDKALKADQYQNPIIAGFYPDPSVVRVGSDFYLVNSTFGYYPGIPIFHSRDLVNWIQLGNVIDRPGMMNFDGIHLSQQGLYAPTIEYHEGTFYVANTCVACGGNYLVTANDPAGPWSDPIWLPDVGGIDPSLFFEDGRVYIVNHNHPEGPELYDGHRAIWIREVDPRSFQPVSERKMLVDGGVDISEEPGYVEGPHLYKVDGFYYLSAAEGGTGMDHRQVVFRSKSIWGPYLSNENNPVLTQRTLDDSRPDPITSTGHADLFEDQQGNCWAVFLGTRTYDVIHFNTGRETFLLPCEWKDGWPTVLKAGEAVPYIVKKPGISQSNTAVKATTGNFIDRETFDEDLPNHWLFVRIPQTTWWRIDDGSLFLELRNQKVGDMAQPSVITRRLQHMNMQATTAMQINPGSEGDEAGLIAIQNDAFYFMFGLGQNLSGESVLRLRQRTGVDDPERGTTLKEMPMNIGNGSTIFLRIMVNGSVADFLYSLDGNTYTSFLSSADATILSTMRAGGFVGALVGMYAESR